MVRSNRWGEGFSVLVLKLVKVTAPKLASNITFNGLGFPLATNRDGSLTTSKSSELNAFPRKLQYNDEARQKSALGDRGPY